MCGKNEFFFFNVIFCRFSLNIIILVIFCILCLMLMLTQFAYAFKNMSSKSVLFEARYFLFRKCYVLCEYFLCSLSLFLWFVFFCFSCVCFSSVFLSIRNDCPPRYLHCVPKLIFRSNSVNQLKQLNTFFFIQNEPFLSLFCAPIHAEIRLRNPTN